METCFSYGILQSNKKVANIFLSSSLDSIQSQGYKNNEKNKNGINKP